MRFLPIVGRELRVASRQRSTYWIRTGAALGGIAIGAWIMLVPIFRDNRTLGPALFISLSILTFVYSLLVGVLRTADCLSEEKREGTLGLLFLTDLKGYDIVVGKLVATSLNAVYGAFAIFPVMAVPLLAGGVSGKQFSHVVICALVTLFFSLSVGMFCSAVCRDDRRALVLSLLVALGFAGGLPALGGILASIYPPHTANPLFFIPSPGYACFMAFDSVALSLPQFNYFKESLATIHSISWALLISACLIVPRTWQDKAASAEKQLRRVRFQRAGLLALEGIREFRTRLLEINPLYWLSSRDRLKPVAIWSLLAVGALVWLWGLSKYPQAWRDTGSYIVTSLFYHTVLKFWIALEAGRCLGVDRKNGALELLLSTPLSVREIVGGHMLALRRLFLAPALTIAGADFIFLLTTKDDQSSVLLWSAGIISFLSDMAVLGPVALWLGMISKSTTRAAAAAVVRIMVLPWMSFAGLLMVTYAATRFSGPGFDEKTVIGIWVGISLAIDATSGFWAWNRLSGSFRQAATQAEGTKRVLTGPSEKPRIGTPQPAAAP
ncbi:MAG TPA: ABC transporter permease subunit [Candidatus Saccharimonadales bacterium]|nr:ABC transporter permease subunit [Candidatus Saccharimonadales bacterium]